MTGILLLFFVFLVLSAPNDIMGIVVDTNYNVATEHRLTLSTPYEYNNKEALKAFPKTLGEWEGRDYKYSDSVYNSLNADVILSRQYTKKSDGSFVWIDIINSKVGQSFHSPLACLKAWNIDNESIVEFSIEDPRVANPRLTNTKFYANRLDYSRKNEKQIMVHWFMIKKIGSNDGTSWVRIIAPVIFNETTTFNNIREFVEGQLLDAMYKQSETKSTTVAEDIINIYGKAGMVAVALAVLIPICIIFAGIRKTN